MDEKNELKDCDRGLDIDDRVIVPEQDEEDKWNEKIFVNARPGKPGRPRKGELVLRARYTRVDSMKAVGALVRVLRLRSGLNQVDAALALGVGRRWYNDLENGKETIRAGMVIDVLRAFNVHLAVGGEGAGFTIDELLNRAEVKNEKEHIWDAEFVRGIAPLEFQPPVRLRTKTEQEMERIAKNRVIVHEIRSSSRRSTSQLEADKAIAEANDPFKRGS